MNEPTLDRVTFHELQDTTGAEFVAELVDTFLEEAPGLLAEMQAALAAGELPRLQRAAHSLKSNASTFGALQLAALARDVELGAAPTTAAMRAVTEAYTLAASALKELQHG